MKRCVSVETPEQMETVLAYGGEHPAAAPARLYLPLSACDAIIWGETSDKEAEAWRRAAKKLVGMLPSARPAIFAALPFILRREQGNDNTADIARILFPDAGGEPDGRRFSIDGVLARCLEEMAFLRERGYAGIIEADQEFPVWNAAAYAQASALFDEWTISPELRFAEIKEMLAATRGEGAGKGTAQAAACAGLVVYGRAPMMVSAGCVRRTTGECAGPGRRERFVRRLTDRKGRRLVVTGDCQNCYNVVRNAVPTSLHRFRRDVAALGIGRVRVELTVETKEETQMVLSLMSGEKSAAGEALPFETTGGRFKSGVE